VRESFASTGGMTYTERQIAAPMVTPVPQSHSRGTPSMALLPSYPEFYPLLLGIMALSTLAMPLMVWWSERR
jgi:hypothetical protein